MNGPIFHFDVGERPRLDNPVLEALHLLESVKGSPTVRRLKQEN